MSNDNFIEQLQEIYNKGDVVPFIGAGLSIPFNIPNWGDLIRDCAVEMGKGNENEELVNKIIDINLKKYDYWEAIRMIKHHLVRSDYDIQEYIVNVIKEKVNYKIDDIKHNYKDLSKYDFNTYLTTNYDHILMKYIESHVYPTNLKDFNDRTQILLNNEKEKRILHLHGSISDVSSIVISNEKYKELYENGQYKKLFSLFTGVKTFLFIGFSFNDIFIQKIINDNNEFFKSKHYIILSNPSNKEREWLKREYNLETIQYDENNSSHSEEIRKIIDSICKKK